MTNYHPDGLHVKYSSTVRHWSPGSEQYTGADSLLTAQRNGWRILHLVYQKPVLLRGGRSTVLYYFLLIRDSERIVMPVLNNPFVRRMLTQRRMLVRSRQAGTDREAAIYEGMMATLPAHA